VSTFGSCALCGLELFEQDTRSQYRQVVGWVPVVRGRAKATALKARRETGALAHADCVEDRDSKMRRGIPVQQKGLF
jgi:hypothetical protein